MEHKTKVKLSNLMIGLGLGFFISGIIISILSYQTSKSTSIETSDEASPQQIEVPVKVEPVRETISQPIGEPVIEENFDEKEQIEDSIEIEFSDSATARDIARTLKEKNVVADYDDFLADIISSGNEKTLIHGKKQFKLNSDNEEALKVLTTYK